MLQTLTLLSLSPNVPEPPAVKISLLSGVINPELIFEEWLSSRSSFSLKFSETFENDKLWKFLVISIILFILFLE